MADYIVAWLEVTTINNVIIDREQELKRRNYQIFNGEDSILNREEATKLYNEVQLNPRIISISFSKIIEAKAFPERLKTT